VLALPLAYVCNHDDWHRQQGDTSYLVTWHYEADKKSNHETNNQKSFNPKHMPR